MFKKFLTAVKLGYKFLVSKEVESKIIVDSPKKVEDLNGIETIVLAQEVEKKHLRLSQESSIEIINAEVKLGEFLRTIGDKKSLAGAGIKTLPEGVSHKRSYRAQKMSKYPQIVDVCIKGALREGKTPTIGDIMKNIETFELIEDNKNALVTKDTNITPCLTPKLTDPKEVAICQELKDKKIESGMSYAELGIACDGVSEGHLSTVFNGFSLPSQRVFTKLTTALNLSPRLVQDYMNLKYWKRLSSQSSMKVVPCPTHPECKTPYIPTTTTLGQDMKSRRKSLGLTTVKLAEEVGVHNSVISNLEVHSKLPSITAFSCICDTLNMPIDAYDSYMKIKYPKGCAKRGNWRKDYRAYLSIKRAHQYKLKTPEQKEEVINRLAKARALIHTS